MAVYVDELVEHPVEAIQPAARRCGRRWCHLWADTEEELHEFARLIGLRREWFQNHHTDPRKWHYDLVPSRRARAIQQGAVVTTWREWRRGLEASPAAVTPDTYYPLYTYGYGGKGQVEDLQAAAAVGALVMDVRLKPWSKLPAWRADALRGLLGTSYRHVQELGNVNYRGGPMVLQAPHRGITILQAELQRRPVVILCGCARAESCHRSLVAQKAQEQMPGLSVAHLTPGDHSGLVPAHGGAGPADT